MILMLYFFFFFSLLDKGVPRAASFGVYKSQLVWFAGVAGRVAGFGAGMFAGRALLK